MADSGRKAAPEASTDATATPAPTDKEAATGVHNPDESNRASKLVRTEWPHSSFAVDGVPVVTSDGTKLTATQLKSVEDVAEANGVKLQVEDVN